MSEFHVHHHHTLTTHSENGGQRLVFSIVLNLTITIAEIIGGFLSGSLALLSDALHNFSDTVSLGISLAAYKVSQRRPDRKNTFGYRRAQIIGAFVNLVTLVIIAITLMKEAVERYFDPQVIRGDVMLVVAVIGLLANLATAALLHRQSKESLNIRSAFVHIMGDAFSSVGVVLAGILINLYQLYITDTILTLLISVYILYHSSQLLRQTINILMQAVPSGIEIEEVIADIKGIDAVQDMHHVHVWQLDETQSNLEAHIVIDACKIEDMTQIKQAIKQHLATQFNITHATLEFELNECDSHTWINCYEGEHGQ
jgi:cobalt-zinc-cadmium efflux system protein